VTMAIGSRSNRPFAGPSGRAAWRSRTVLALLIAPILSGCASRPLEIGILILLPFLVVDLVVATIVMSMGMMMLPPTAISLPFKILFFVLIAGWNLLAGGLVRSFN